MNTQRFAWCVPVLATAIAMGWAAPARSQAPGEDPVILTKKLTVQMLPTGAAAPSTGLDNNNAMP